MRNTTQSKSFKRTKELSHEPHQLAAVLAVRGMGQRELAEMCKVTPRTVRNWLSGKAPSPTVFALISTKWGEDTFNYLVGESNTMPEPQPEPVRVAQEDRS